MQLPVVVKYCDDEHSTHYGLLVKSDERHEHIIQITNDLVRVKKYRGDGSRNDVVIKEYLDKYPVENFWKVLKPKIEKYGITKEAEGYVV